MSDSPHRRPARRPATQLVHAGEPELLGAVAMPLFPSSNYVDPEGLAYHDIRYARLGTVPNQKAVAEKLAAVCGGDAALVLGSGMAAMTTTLLAHLSAGDHLLVQPVLYGGTMALVHEDLPRWGITVDALTNDPSQWAAQIRPNTRAVVVESLTNPLLRTIDHRAVISTFGPRGVLTVIDNTVASPVNFQPLALGYDLEVQSATKYLGGHSDVVAGAVIGSDDAVLRIQKMMGHLGASLDPRACWILQRGMKTMHLRVRQQNLNAEAIAAFLDDHPRVGKVNYPSVPNHDDHGIAHELFDGFGGLLSFDLRTDDAGVRRFLDTVSIFKHAPSFGGVESLVTRPASSSHAGVPKEKREALGITDTLVRMAVGVEDVHDLVADLERALARI